MTTPTPSDSKLVRSADGTNIFAEATGSHSNPHVVLLPGIGFSGCVFDDFCADARLLDALYIVRVDPRGCGRSDEALTEEMHESKRYAEDFDAVAKAFDLHKPVLVAWSYGGTWLCDIVAHLPPATLSGCMSLMGLPYAQMPVQLLTPAVIGAFPGLLSSDARASQTSIRAFVDLMFADPPVLTYAQRCTYYGHRMEAALVRCLTRRAQPREALWDAVRAGLPLYFMYGTADGHDNGEVVLQMLQEHCTRLEVNRVEGGTHALHVDNKEELLEAMVGFVRNVYGKDYREGALEI